MTTTPRQNRTSQPWLHQQGSEIQAFGSVRQFTLGLSYDARMYSCERLNQILADTQILYALYKHAGEQVALVDAIAERV